MATGGDFYGFNANAIQNEVTKFADGAANVMKLMNTSFKNFMTDVNAYWASDNAVDFQKFANDEEQGLENIFSSECTLVLEDVIRGIRTFTASHGGAGVNCSGNAPTSTGDFGTTFVNNHNGMVGMNADRLMDTAVTNYKAQIKKITDAIEALPKSISLVDPQSQASASFSFAVDRTASRIAEFSSALETKITSYLNTEIQDVEIGANTASVQIAGN